MGIKLLNTLMKRYAPKGVKIVRLKDLKDRKIAIDISIYLYKYKSQNMLLTNMYKLCSIFNYYNIDVLFVFDGQPTKKKTETILQRNKQKYEAKQAYYKIIDTCSDDYIKTNKNKLYELKKSFTRIKKDDIDNVKKLLESYGMKYYMADREADHVCGQLVNNKYIDGCFSDDMDMFVYKSRYVYRNLDIVNGTCLQYDLNLILDYLNMGFEDFKWMCVLSQNDYNANTCTKNVFEYYKLYLTYLNDKKRNQYKKQLYTLTDKYSSFIEYVKTKEFMSKIEFNKLCEIYNLYDTNQDIVNNANIVNKCINDKMLCEILEKDNFIYPPSHVQVC